MEFRSLGAQVFETFGASFPRQLVWTPKFCLLAHFSAGLSMQTANFTVEISSQTGPSMRLEAKWMDQRASLPEHPHPTSSVGSLVFQALNSFQFSTSRLAALLIDCLCWSRATILAQLSFDPLRWSNTNRFVSKPIGCKLENAKNSLGRGTIRGKQIGLIRWQWFGGASLDDERKQRTGQLELLVVIFRLVQIGRYERICCRLVGQKRRV